MGYSKHGIRQHRVKIGKHREGRPIIYAVRVYMRGESKPDATFRFKGDQEFRSHARELGINIGWSDIAEVEAKRGDTRTGLLNGIEGHSELQEAKVLVDIEKNIKEAHEQLDD